MKKLLDPIMKCLEWLAVAVLGLSIIFVVIQIVSRYVFSSPVPWTEQGARYLFVWLVMIAIPISYYKGNAFAFDLILEKFPQKVALIVSTITNLLCLVFTVYYFWQSLQLCITAGWRVSSGIPIKMGYLYVAQPICAITLSLVIIGQIVDGIITMKNLKRGEVK